MLKVIKKWNCTFSLQHAKKSVRTELQQSLSLVICSTFEVLHCWILQKIVQKWILRHLAKVLQQLGKQTIYFKGIFVNLKRWDSFYCIFTFQLDIKSFAIGKCVKIITALSVWIFFFQETCLRSRNLKITTKIFWKMLF